MLTMTQDRLTIRFPEIHPDAVCHIEFQRTLRIPDDNRTHDLPPGLGRFPLAHVDDFADRLPAAWHKRGGVFLPMHQSEAMWVKFTSNYPFAVKIAAGKINAVTGKPWSTELEGPQNRGGLMGPAVIVEQDYLSVPKQPWLDGFCVEKGKIRQFVAMPMGEGYTAEEQITGEAVHGGLQIIVYPLKAEYHRPRPSALRSMVLESAMCASASSTRGLESFSGAVADMGMAPGGLMEQTIHKDTRTIDQYDQGVSAKCFVHLLNSEQYQQVTGNPPPHKAPTAADYTSQGLPWFKLWEPNANALPGGAPLKALDSVANLGNKKGQSPLPDNAPLPVKPAVIPVKHPNQVREGDF